MDRMMGVALIVSLAAGAAAGAGAGAAMTRDSGAEARRLDAALGRQKDEIAALRAELQKQQAALSRAARDIQAASAAQENAALARESGGAAGTARPGIPGAPGAGGGTESAPGSAVRAPGPGAASSDPVDAHVQELVQREMEKRDQERKERERKQAASGMKWMMDQQLQELSKKLSLTEYQKGEMKKVWEDGSQKLMKAMEPMLSGGGDDPEGKGMGGFMETFKQIRDDAREKSRTFLTPQQHDDFVKWQKEQESHGMMMMSVGTGDEKPAEAK